MTTFNVYRRYSTSESPVQIATGLTVKSYSDTTVTQGATALYSIGAVQNGVEKISDEISVLASAPISYRYFRLYITTNNSSSYTALQEIELASDFGGADITNPSMLTDQSSYYDRNNMGNHVIDNNFTDPSSSAWTTAPGLATPSWVYVDLGSKKTVKEIRIYPQNFSGGADRAPKYFIVQGSNDASSWADVKSFSNVTGWAAGTGRVFNLIDGTYT